MEDPQLQPQSFPAADSRHTRVMGKLRDSLLSELAASNPAISVNSDYGSHIQRRLKELFSSFNTPSHPPYALMIQRALIELNDATGSTKEAISEFIKREYKDLPWAHTAILGYHLRKLCDAGELLCTENGRYRVYNGNLGSGGEINKALERSEDVGREKELQGQENEKQTQVSVLQIIETNEPSRMQETQGIWIQEEVEAYEHSIERSEEQNKSGNGFLGIFEQQCLLQRQEIGVIEGHNDVKEYHRVVAQAESESENFQNIKIQQIQMLDEATHFGDPEQQLPKRQGRGRPTKLKSGADKSTSQKQKQLQSRGGGRPPKLHGWHKQQQLQPYSRGQGQCRRRKLHRDAHRCEEQLQPEDQGQGPVSSLNLDAHQCEEQLQLEDQTQGPVNALNLDAHQCGEQLQPGDLTQGALNFLNSDAHQCEEQLQLEDQTQGPVNSLNLDAHRCEEQLLLANFLNSQPEEKIYSFQPMELNLPGTLALISKQQMVVPISQGSPEFMPVIVNELSQTQLCGPSGTDLGVKSQVSVSSTLLNVNNHDQPQHWDQGSPKRNLFENTTLKYLEQQPQKRRRGRPPKSKPDACYPGESLPLEDSILNEQNPNVISTSQKQQPSQNQRRVRGRGRPRKIHTDALQCMEQVQPQDQAQGLVSAPNSEPNEIQGQEQKQLPLESQAQSWQKPPNLESGVDESYTLLPQGSSQDEGRLSKENTPAEQSQAQQLHEFSGVLGSRQSRGKGRGQGRGRGRGRGRGVLGRPPKPTLDSNESKQLPQSQPCLGQVRRRGRPPKRKPLSQDSQPVLDAWLSFQQLQSQPMSDVCQNNQQLHSQPCQIQDQILKSPAEPQPEVDISSTSSMLVYKRKKTDVP